MNRHVRIIVGTLAGIGLSVGLVATATTRAQTASPSPSAAQKKEPMTTRATGTFEVKVTPQASEDKGDGAVGRMTLDKQFHGDIEGTSKGEMLTAMTAVKGSAGYVAIERVTAALGGRKGTFALQHTGIMTRGTPSLTITVVPDSGTDQLAGLRGKMAIVIGADGKHSYEFDYTLADNP
jgi:hypothetical protein